MTSLGPVELLIIAVFVLVAGLVVVGVVTTALASLRGGRRTGGLEQRLRELDDLRARGVISPEEHAAARARALGGS